MLAVCVNAGWLYSYYLGLLLVDITVMTGGLCLHTLGCDFIGRGCRSVTGCGLNVSTLCITTFCVGCDALRRLFACAFCLGRLSLCRGGPLSLLRSLLGGGDTSVVCPEKCDMSCEDHVVMKTHVALLTSVRFFRTFLLGWFQYRGGLWLLLVSC